MGESKEVIAESEVASEAESTKDMKQSPRKDTIKKPRRSLTQRNIVLQS
jgi:hypothetical protein